MSCCNSSQSCDCCEDVRQVTPLSRVNRPGLPALIYRAGTHGAFLETMKARLGSLTIDGTSHPLAGLTIRETDDFSIALLDGWATVADVLTFYQERIANEGYLRTATERRSVLELARLVGYSLRPGVSATAYLAYTIEPTQADPVEIPAGSRAQSIPGPGEQPQSFETSDALQARSAWNNLQVRLTRPQNITLETALVVESIQVTGTSTNLRKGDLLLLVFAGADGERYVLRTVHEALGQFAEQKTTIQLEPVQAGLAAAVRALLKFVGRIPDEDWRAQYAEQMLENAWMTGTSDIDKWVWKLSGGGEGPPPILDQPLADLDSDVEKILAELSKPVEQVVTDPSQFVNFLLKTPVIQSGGSMRLSRNLAGSFAQGADASPQLLVNLAPQVKGGFYAAWENATVNGTAPALSGLYAMRVTAPLFGTNSGSNNGEGLDRDERSHALFLDQAYEAILPSGYAIIDAYWPYGDRGSLRLIRKVVDARTLQRYAYGIPGKTTQLTFSNDWWKPSPRPEARAVPPPQQTTWYAEMSMETLRGTLVHAQSERLTLADETIGVPVQGQEIELAGLYRELTSGRWIILSGERTDIPGVTGVKGCELLMVSGLNHGFDPELPGDQTHTTLLLAAPVAYSYKRGTLKIFGNVAKATHGETRNETLGSGDGSQALQSFTLKQPPLTFVAAPTAAGAESTLKVYVNDVEWHEVGTLAGLGPKDRSLVTETDNDGRTTVIFGNGEQGARLPTGIENVKSVYRNGIGKPGNVQAEQISLLLTRPLGVKSVVNPLRASGGANAEEKDQARENAPLAVMALDRLVSVQDYADFARTYAGIGKALSSRLSDRHRELVHLTVAGADDIPIDPSSDLYRNLAEAVGRLGDPDLPVQIDARELVVLVLSAKLRLAADHLWEPVVTAVRAALLDTFGFHRRDLAQPAILSEVIQVIQGVPGVDYVDVDAFGGVPEKTIAEKTVDSQTHAVRLLTLPEISSKVVEIAAQAPAQWVTAAAARFEQGFLRPAQLAIFTPDVPDTLILNQLT